VSQVVQVLDILLTSAPAGGVYELPAAARKVIFLRAVDANGDDAPTALLQISVGGTGDNTFIPFTFGDEITDTRDVRRLRLKWAAQTGITVSLAVIGDPSIVNFRPTPTVAVSTIAGTVNVDALAGATAYTTAGAAFIAGTEAGPVAAQYPYIQLWNPASSGKTLVVDAVELTAGVDGSYVYLGYHDSALGAVLGVGGGNLSLGGAAPVGGARYLTSATAPAALLTAVIAQGIRLSSTGPGTAPFPLRFPAPVEVPEGRGLVFALAGVNVQFGGYFHWREA
jgi:hypothetical protein